MTHLLDTGRIAGDPNAMRASHFPHSHGENELFIRLFITNGGGW
jgi:hypothetical protein